VSVPGDRVISIVDDDESVREAIESLMRSVGLNAQVFASAEDFLHSHHPEDTSCLILDMRMPGMSGLELQRRLAAGGYRIPIIFISARRDDQIRAQALRAGAVDFLFKPFSEQALVTAVHTALGQSKHGASAVE
jgi:FixJ family two-component response regulator